MSGSPTSWSATCSTMGEPKRTVTQVKNSRLPGVTQVRHHANWKCFLLVYQWQLENENYTYSWCKVSCHIHAQEFIIVQELINYGYLFIFIIRKTVLRYWWIDKKPNQQLEDERVPLWEASNSPLSPAPRGDSETLDRIHTRDTRICSQVWGLEPALPGSQETPFPL